MAAILKSALLLIFAGSLVNCNSSRKTPHCDSGKEGQVLVHLFSWRWKDIAQECERVLGPKGFCGVQVSPPNEHRIVTSPNRPWWERYQPVSYKLDSASGSRAEFIDMVNRCNAVGVKIYIDAVINHMVGAGSGKGTGGSYFNYDQQKYDGVPYGPNDFGKTCTTGSGQINDYNNPDEVRNCALLGLADLNGGSNYVRRKIADFFDDMLGIGIDGYRIDAAKHMWPGDLDATIGMTKQTKSGEVPFVFQEVIDLSGSEPIKSEHYKHIGRVTEFKYGIKLAETFQANKIALTHLKNFGSSWGMLADGDALVFVDNHDNQRGHGGAGSVVTYKNSRAYKMAVAFMLSWPYGVPRVMSSYKFTTDDGTGPPSGAPGSSGICENGWVCEHRWRQILNMVEWRNQAGNNRVSNWWSNGNNQIAFSRGSASFIVFNKNDGNMDANIKTGLPAGSYCDIISGNVENGKCTGKVINVAADSTANIQIDGSSENPFIAIHAGSKVGSGSSSSPSPQLPSEPPTGLQRTIVFLQKNTAPGQNVFLRGGCGSTCELPITYPSPRSGTRFNEYNTWSVGDTKLDWEGAESGQGQVGGVKAKGSPMVWTDSDSTSPSHVPENTYGDHYWMWDVHMNCSQTANGYFMIKGYSDGWEPDVSQTTCTGQSGSTSLDTKNHVARCGAKNVFQWGSSTCIMETL